MVAAALFNVGINALAGAGVLFGTTTGAVSDMVETGVTPAGWAFSIWSVIFVGVLVFAGYQALPRARGARFDAIAIPFILANLLNGLWQIPWLNGMFVVAAVVIVGILGSLIWLYIRLDRLEMTTGERWALGVPTSLFLAWLSVATALNITIALAAAGWEGTAIWPPLLILVIVGIGGTLLSRTGGVAFATVLVWAFAAIYAANVPAPGDAPALTAALGAGVLAVAVAVVFAIRRGSSPLPVTTYPGWYARGDAADHRLRASRAPSRQAGAVSLACRWAPGPDRRPAGSVASDTPHHEVHPCHSGSASSN